MLLIIEGMDNCGKSTLINQLRKDYFTRPRTIVHHSSSPPNDTDMPDLWESRHYDDLFSTFKELVENDIYDVLLDRFHLGAIVYGAKYRQSPPGPIRSIDEHHLSDYNNAALLLLTDSYDGIMERDDGDSIEQSIEEYEDVRSRFKLAFKDSFCVNKLHIDIRNDVGTIDKVLPTVLEWLNKIEE